MNLPNKLTVLRILMVPLFMAVMILPEAWVPAALSQLLGVFLFIAASLTDMLDGKIARKYNLVTDFGKFMDPLADKFMVIGAMMILLYRYESIRPVFIWAAILVIFRELAVTSMRLVVSGSSGIVVAANMLGKIKTVTQIVCVCTVILEPLIYTLPFMGFLPVWVVEALPLTYLSIVVMAVFTAWSGINYIAAYWKYLDPQK